LGLKIMFGWLKKGRNNDKTKGESQPQSIEPPLSSDHPPPHKATNHHKSQMHPATTTGNGTAPATTTPGPAPTGAPPTIVTIDPPIKTTGGPVPEKLEPSKTGQTGSFFCHHSLILQFEMK
jgi:hypothetical protein